MIKAVSVVTLFPEMFTALTESGVTGRSFRERRIALSLVNPRQFTNDRHQTVDDKPYGGGPGMVMKVEPLAAAVEAARQQLEAVPDVSPEQAAMAPVVYMSPQGQTLNTAKVQELCDIPALILVAGRYEGVDERFIERHVDEEISIGDFVLSGGELPAMVVLDAIARRIPGTVGDADSVTQDSFEDGFLDYPHYTRPETFAGMTVPSELLSGNHRLIAHWRRREALRRTFERRPDLLDTMILSDDEQLLLASWKKAQS